MRGATQSLLLHYTFCNVSTHAPHARSDTSSSLLGASVPSFNSRSSCEERPPCGFSYLDIMKFQLTLLMRGATIKPPMQAQSRTFQLTLLMRGATPCPGLAPFIFGFNSRSSCEERPIPSSSIIGFHQVSTHAPHARSDAFLDEGVHVKLLFQLTLLMRGATSRLKLAVSLTQFQLTLLMRGATRERGLLSNSTRVSTHAPHARSDVRLLGLILNIFVSTHAPHARSDLYRHHLSSTHPRFNSRSSCEERRRYQTAILEISSFNSRSSCEERHPLSPICESLCRFQLTLLMRGATYPPLFMKKADDVSTHAPHARSDRDSTS